MAKEKEISYARFQEQFSSDEACQKYLFQVRFPNGFVCPKCGCIECYEINTRNLYQCKECRHQATVTSGSVMHRSHLTLRIWFWAIFLVSKDKRGYSAAQLSRELDLSYKTAWFLLQRIRSSMGQRDEKYSLSGIVELDDTYFGKATRGGKRGRGTKKTKVIVAVSKSDAGKPLFVRMQVIPNLKSKTIGKFVTSKIETGSHIQTDAYNSYRKPLSEKYEHDYKTFDPDDDMLHWLHIIIGNSKSFVLGTFHGLGKKYLQQYLDEFCYRFNRRFQPNIFSNLVVAVSYANPISLAELKG
jgi:transposase-like protein